MSAHAPAQLLPPDFRFGVATAGFQTEGGFNGPGEPANNWERWEREGRVEPSGIAVRFWDDWATHLDLAVAAGCDAFRLSVEWARCEPARGAFDEDAFARYRLILEGCAARGLRPLVTLHHFTHPAWLGEDFWLSLDSPERFVHWVAAAVERLGDLCSDWVTINELNGLAISSYLLGQQPPGRFAEVRSVVRSMDHLLAAHVLAFRAIHRLQPDATVSTNTYAMSAYEADRALTDLLVARGRGVGRHDLRAWLCDRRRDWYAALPAAGPAERALRHVAATCLPLGQALPRSAAAVYDAEGDGRPLLDVIQIDFYDPFVGAKFRPPFHQTAGGRAAEPLRQLWDDPPDPPGLARWCELCAEPGLDVWVVENGLCNRVRRGRAFPRGDGWDRPRYLQANVAAVVDAVAKGVPVTAYFHWSLTDNYEWGSYEPRFGLYGVDRERGVRILDVDSMGADAAGTYRRLTEGLRAGDRSVLR